jgi:hypothetical protein
MVLRRGPAAVRPRAAGTGGSILCQWRARHAARMRSDEPAGAALGAAEMLKQMRAGSVAKEKGTVNSQSGAFGR